jgi:hypothetical protein
LAGDFFAVFGNKVSALALIPQQRADAGFQPRNGKVAVLGLRGEACIGVNDESSIRRFG